MRVNSADGGNTGTQATHSMHVWELMLSADGGNTGTQVTHSIDVGGLMLRGEADLVTIVWGSGFKVEGAFE